MKGLIDLLKLIYGSKIMSRTLGTRTNVIRLPDNNLRRYIKEDLNIEAASDELAKKAYKDMEQLIPEVPRMNDAQRLIFEGNLRRLANKLKIRQEWKPTAEVFEFGTKEKVTPKGIETLTEQAGQKSPPGTVMGNLESRLNKLRASGKELGDIAKEEGGVKFSIPEKGMFNQELSADNLFDTIIKQQEKFRKIQNSGLVTSTAREILQRDIKAGKLKLPKEIEDRIMLVDGNPGTVDPVEVFRTNYGEDALEQVDSLIPELAKAQSYSDLIKIVEKKYPMKPLAKPRKETMSLDEATKAEEENILIPKKPDEPEEFSTGGRVGYMGGGSTGLDYLMGIDRKNYQQGSAPVDELIINLLKSGSGDGTQSTSTTSSPPSTFQPTKMDMVNLLFSPVMGIANIMSRRATGLSLVERAMDAMGIGRGPGGRTEGYGIDAVNPMSMSMSSEDSTSVSSDSTHGVDSVNEGSVSADASAGGAAGAAAASAAGSNDGPGGGTFAQGGIVNRTGFKFGTKFGRFWKIARKVWDDINATGDRKYDAQLVADELAEQIFKTSMDDLPQNVQIDLYALAYNNAPKVDALFTNPQSLSEAGKKGMAASKEMESLGLDVTKNSDFFKYEEMKLSGQLGPEHQVQAYKDKIRDEFSGVIDDTLMKQVEVDDNPQRLAEVYASIKEGLTMQEKGMTPEEIVRIMKQTPRTKNSQGGLNYLMGY